MPRDSNPTISQQTHPYGCLEIETEKCVSRALQSGFCLFHILINAELKIMINGSMKLVPNNFQKYMDVLKHFF